jgi:hypothetical protein
METLLHPGNTGGTIINLIKKQEELEEKLRRTDEDNKKILAKEAELHEIRKIKSEAEHKRAGLLDLDECYCNVKLIQSFDELHKLEKTLDERTEACNEYIFKNTRNGFAPTQEYITDIAVARRTVDDTYRRVGEAQETYNKEKSAIGITRDIEGAIELSDSFGGETQIIEKVNTCAQNRIKFLSGAIIGILLFIAAAVTEIAGGALPLAVKIIVGILGAAALGGAGYLFFRFFGTAKEEASLCESFGTETTTELKEKVSVIASARTKRDTLINNTENARRSLEVAKSDYEKAKNELTEVIVRWGDEPPVSDVGAYLNDLEERAKTFINEKNALIEEKTNLEIAVKEIRRSLADKSEIDVRAKVSPLKRKVLSEINHEEILTGISEAKTIIDEQQRLSFNVENELSELKMRARDPGELYSKIQALETDINDLRQKHKAYFVALRAINNATDNLRAEISPRLGDFSTDVLSVMTDNKYSHLGVDNGLKATFTTSDGKEKSVDYLSSGTRDLTYIAVRMALIDMLYGEKPPITFDETFANQDNARAMSMMKAIK